MRSKLGPVSTFETGRLGRTMAESPLAFSGFLPIFEQPVNSTSSVRRSNIKTQVQKFWQRSPCDSWFTNEARGTLAFYRSLDEHRYKVHRRLQSAVGFEKTSGLRVLEIGCGCGSEAERFARAGAHYTAVDLTNAAVSIRAGVFNWQIWKDVSSKATLRTCRSVTVRLTSCIPTGSSTTHRIRPGPSARFIGCSLRADAQWSCSITATRSITT